MAMDSGNREIITSLWPASHVRKCFGRCKMSYKHVSCGLRFKSRSPSSAYPDLSTAPLGMFLNMLFVVPQKGSDAGGPSSFPLVFQLLEAVTPGASPWQGGQDTLIVRPAGLEQAWQP